MNITPVIGYAVIGNVGSVDIVDMRVQYGINEVPTATVVVPPGSHASGSRSNIDRVMNLASSRSTISIYLKLGADSNEIFSGYIAAIQPTCTFGDFGVQISAVHWLDDLRRTSAFTSARTPGAVWDIQKPFVYGKGAGAFETGTLALPSIMASSTVLYDQGNLGYAIFKISSSLASGLGSYALPGSVKNNGIMAVLDKARSRIIFSFNVAPVQESVSGAMAATFSTAFDGNNLWDIWCSLAQQYRFVILPSSRYVTLAARTPVLKSQATRITVHPSEYVAAERTHNTLLSPLAGLALVDTIGLPIDSDLITTQVRSVYYVPGAEKANVGAIDVAQVPSWLAPTISTHTSPQTAAKIGKLLGHGIRTSSSDSTATAERNSNAAARADIGSRYAQSLYLDRRFGQNYAYVTLPPRLDIGVGRPVAIYAPGTLETEQYAVYGYVNNVIVEVSSERHAASTVLGLSHIRTSTENDQVGMIGNEFYTQPTVDGVIADAAPTRRLGE